MRLISFSTLLAACLATCSAAAALDSVKISGGKTVSGEITGMTSREVAITVLGKTKTVPVNEIASISFDGSPNSLNAARSAAGNGRYEDALKMLEKIKPDEIGRDLVKQEVEFYKALCAARLALAGEGEIHAAGKMMNEFVASHPNSCHWLQANELVGDLLVANKSFDLAVGYYDKLEKTPWPDYRMKAQAAIGWAKLCEGKTEEASKCFQSVLQTNASGKAAETQKTYAQIGMARCLAEENRSDEAVKLLQEIILAAEPEDGRLLARAYNALGSALKKGGKPNDALLAFLHVDVLYFSSPEEHAEALANLAELWNEVNKPERAIAARRTLQERYKNSRWATQ